MKKRAVIYCRVSSVDQVENTSLSMQAKQCDEYCKSQGWNVAKTFIEEGESAKTTDRKELLKLLMFCRDQKNYVGYIVVWKIDRFSRNLYDYLQMKKEMAILGVSIRSVSEPFKDDPEGELMASIFATFAQYDNDLRAKRTKEGMYSRLNEGCWVTKAPMGYQNSRTRDGKPTIAEDPATSNFVKKAFELASRGVPQQEICDHLTSMGMKGKQSNKFLKQSLHKILVNRAYIGEVKLKTGQYIIGKHSPIIDRDIFDRVQGVLRGNIPWAVQHSRKNPDFPLRNFVVCAKCNTPLTGSFSTGKSGKKYPYYRCPDSMCLEVNTRKEKIESDFFSLLESLKPSKEYLDLTTRVFTDIYNSRNSDNVTIKSNLESDIDKLAQQKKRLTNALAEGVLDPVDYKSAVDEIESKKIVKTLELQDLKIDIIEIESVLEWSKHIIMNAANIWSESNLEQRDALQRVYFPEGLKYSKEGFEVPETGLFFKLCSKDEVFQENVMGCLNSQNWNILLQSIMAIYSLRSILNKERV